MKSSGETLEELAGQLSNEFAIQLSRLASDPILCTAIIQMSIRDISWSIHEHFPNSKYDISEQLLIMSKAIKDE